MDGIYHHNLPELPNPLLGRDKELKDAQEVLRSNDVHLLNLIGPPGVGKTRLAMEIARSTFEAFPDGVYFVDLALLKDPALVESEVANTLRIPETHDDTTFDRLAKYLRRRQVLLFLDNFEGVLQAAYWVGGLLERTPGLKILTTSRERLRLSWERTLSVIPLSLPDLHILPELSTLERIPSIALFVQRATAVNANFVLSAENAPIIAALCTRLDGLPLAIELAAARSSSLSPAEILANMDDRFRLLDMGAIDLPERHQTLKAAIDWSYEALSPAEAQFLRRLAVFSGGFSVKAAEIVCESKTLGLDSLSSLIDLVEKSLVNKVRRPTGETRFTLFESIRAYLLDRLRVSGEMDDAVRRYIGYYLEFAEQNFLEMEKANMRASYDLLEIEHDNLRAALEWSLQVDEYSLGKSLAAAIWYFWGWRGHMREGVRWLETFLESGDETKDETHLRVLEGAGTLRAWQGDFERARTLLMEALQLAEEGDDSGATIRVLAWLGWIFCMNGETEEAIWLAERIEGIEAYPGDLDPWDLSYAYFSLGSLLYEANLDEAAEREFARSLEILQFDRENYTAIHAEFRLALLTHKKGQYQEAKEEMMRVLNAARHSNARPLMTSCTDAALRILVQGMDQNIASPKTSLEMLAQLLGTVDYWREILSSPRSRRDRESYTQITEILKRRMGERSFLEAWTEGQSISIESAVVAASEQLALPGRAEEPRSERSAIDLSERESQVLALVSEGLTAREIGERLFITERTVRFHINSIFNKLGANNRAQAVAIASRMGIL